jgi:hypothetical protein
VVQQELLQAPVLVAATNTPDGGPITLQAGGDRLDGFPGGNGQHDARMLDLEEGQVTAACHGLQNGNISGSDRQGMRLSATHGDASNVQTGAIAIIPFATNLLHYFCPGPLGFLIHGSHSA